MGKIEKPQLRDNLGCVIVIVILWIWVGVLTWIVIGGAKLVIGEWEIRWNEKIPH